MGLPRVTPPKDDSQPAGTTPKAMGSRAPVTPPKAGPPKPEILKVPPGGGEDKKGKEKERIEPGPAKRPVDPKGVKATPKSPVQHKPDLGPAESIPQQPKKRPQHAN